LVKVWNNYYSKYEEFDITKFGKCDSSCDQLIRHGAKAPLGPVMASCRSGVWVLDDGCFRDY